MLSHEATYELLVAQATPIDAPPILPPGAVPSMMALPYRRHDILDLPANARILRRRLRDLAGFLAPLLGPFIG